MSVRSIVAGFSAAALAIATLSPAMADDHRGHHRRGHYSYDRDGHDDRSYSDHRYRDNHGYSKYGYYDRYGNYRQYRRGGDNGTALGVGLGVVGLALVLGAMSSGNKNKSRDAHKEYRDDRYDRDGWYRGETSRRDDGNWRNPDDDFAFRSYQGAATQFSSNECLESKRLTVAAVTPLALCR
jgi:hypothetical protein